MNTTIIISIKEWVMWLIVGFIILQVTLKFILFILNIWKRRLNKQIKKDLANLSSFRDK